MKQLLNVSKPLRYTGGEFGEIKKETKDKLRFCLTFPDVYEIGMSHIGFRLLYTKLNQSNNIAAERFFAPWPDAWQTLGSNIMVSLENKIHLKDFHIIGFSMQYELAYTTALQLLKMADIPLKSIDRTENTPIIIAGGGCILNPAPLSEFIDVFFLGEMDEQLVHAMEKLYQYIKDGRSRKEQLLMLNEYSFTYIPSINPEKKTRREVYQNFSQDTSAPAPFVPLMPIIQDRIAVEIARGCTNGCRFCQAGMIYRPVREKNVSNLCDTVQKLISMTGYQEASLLSLDTGDYSQINNLLDTLSTELAKKNVSLSLPSLRAETVNPELFEKISKVRKSGFTIAPEAGTQRLRDIINKNLSEEDIINAALYAKNAGFNGAKLYFMCGLPYETDEDILGIAELIKKIRFAVRGGKFFDLTVSVSNFVPKPHTPFERFGQNSIQELIRKHMLLKNVLKTMKVKFKFHDAYASSIEAAISRGDKRLGKLFEYAVSNGFYLDAWSEYFSREKWNEMFAENGYSSEDFACANFSDNDTLPWGMVDSGIDSSWLLNERNKAENAVATKDCRTGDCSNCGVCGKKAYNSIADKENIAYEQTVEKNHDYKQYELIFEKKDVASFMSALDLSRIFSHMLLASGINIKFSNGFNPQPKIVVQAPMPVGVNGTKESLLLDADLGNLSKDEFAKKLNESSPAGLKILAVNEKKWPKNLSSYEITLEFDNESFDFLNNAIISGTASYNKLDKKGNPKSVSLSDYLIRCENNTVTVLITEKGGFHFPEYFRKAKYGKQPDITRIKLVNINSND